MLTMEDLRLIWDAMEAKYGRGYSKIPEVARVQAKLSVLSEAACRRESRSVSVPCSDSVDSPA